MNKKSISIIKKPVLTSKSYDLTKNNNCYSFFIAKNANKKAVKQSVEKIFSVKVESVNTCNYKGKKKVHKGTIGKRSNKKKAFVKLKSGYHITEMQNK